MKSTSISRSRQASRYSMLVVRTMTFARESFLTSIADTRLAFSFGLQAIRRSISSTPARRSTALVAPLPSTVRTS